MEHKSNGVTPTGQNALEEAPNQSAGEARKGMLRLSRVCAQQENGCANAIRLSRVAPVIGPLLLSLGPCLLGRRERTHAWGFCLSEVRESMRGHLRLRKSITERSGDLVLLAGREKASGPPFPAR